MTKKQLLIVSVVGVLLLGGAVIGAILSNKKTADQPVAVETDIEDQPTTELEPEDLGTDGVDADVPPLKVNGVKVEPIDVKRQYIPLAEKAAREYVFQKTKESNKARQKRLRAVFAPGSPVITKPAPKVDLSGSIDITANPIVVDTSWTMDMGQLVATISLRVICRSNTEPYDDVSSIYQAYDVRFVRYNDSYMPQSVTFSDKPVIVRKS